MRDLVRAMGTWDFSFPNTNSRFQISNLRYQSKLGLTPLGYFSSSLRTVWSQNSKTRCSFRFRRNTFGIYISIRIIIIITNITIIIKITSIRLTKFGCFRFFSILKMVNVTITETKGGRELRMQTHNIYALHMVTTMMMINDNDEEPDLSKSNLLDERVVLALHKLLDGNQVA